MTLTIVAIVFLSICAAVGLARARGGSNTVVAAGLAATMVCVQFLLLQRM